MECIRSVPSNWFCHSVIEKRVEVVKLLNTRLGVLVYLFFVFFNFYVCLFSDVYIYIYMRIDVGGTLNHFGSRSSFVLRMGAG